MNSGDIPEATIRAVSKKLRHYIDVQRREEGFDTSQPNNFMGNFNSGIGTAGTFYYNSLQDKHLRHYFEQPAIRQQLVELGVVHPGMFRPLSGKGRRRRSKSVGEHQRNSAKMENAMLLTTSARLLLSSGYCSYYKATDERSLSVHPQSDTQSTVSHRSESIRSNHSTCSQSTLRPHSRVASDYTPSQLSNKTASSINTSTRSKLTHSPTKTSLLDSPQRITGVNKCACSCLCGVKGRPVSSPRPLSRTAVRYSVGVNTVSTSETTTQTPVDVATQTDKSKLMEMSSKSKRRVKIHSKRHSLCDLSSEGDKSEEKQTIQELIRAGHSVKVKEIISQNPNILNTLDEQGLTPLHIACSTGNHKIAKLLCEAGANLAVESNTGYVPAHYAAINGHTACLKVLSSLGCELDIKTVDGYTPLHLAARSGHKECYQWLVDNGVDLSSEDNAGRTPHNLAKINGHMDIASILTTHAESEAAN